MNNEITFSFGENWQNFNKSLTDEQIVRAKEDIQCWLGDNYITGKSVVDIGSGSGIHSLAFYLLGANYVYSFDFDIKSVNATKSMWERARKPSNWKVSNGSILDLEFIKSLGKFDIVYCWGVLFATGAMWKALYNTLNFVSPGGTVWFTMYQKGPRYKKDLALKKKYNKSTWIVKHWMIYKYILKIMIFRVRTFRNPFSWNEKKSRGMTAYHDILDWFGGLPYEVAGEDEVLQFCKKYNFISNKFTVAKEGGCSNYLFNLPKSEFKE